MSQNALYLGILRQLRLKVLDKSTSLLAVMHFPHICVPLEQMQQEAPADASLAHRKVSGRLSQNLQLCSAPFSALRRLSPVFQLGGHSPQTAIRQIRHLAFYY